MLPLLAFDKHDGPGVIMPAFENIVDDRDEENSAKHGGRPVPGFRSQYHTATGAAALT
jgi:hypothetical protein